MKEQPEGLSTEWLAETRDDLILLLAQTRISDADLSGTRGGVYPEWLIVFIAILSAKLGLDSFRAIYAASNRYWDIIAEGTGLKPISEQQLRKRLKQIGHLPDRPAAFIYQLFPDLE